MKLRSDQLDAHLKKNILPVYLISGDDVCLMQESLTLFRKSAVQIGYSSREIMHVDSHFDWNAFLSQANNFNLFSSRTLVELRMPTAKPGTTGGKVLKEYFTQPPSDKVLLIITDKLDAATQATTWFKALDKVGGIIQIWPLTKPQFQTWIKQKLAHFQLQIDPAGLILLAEQYEGNLLALEQEIIKLNLLYGPCRLTVDQLQQSISESSQFDVFMLIDTAMLGDTNKALHILARLRLDAAEPIFILACLTKEIRNLLLMIFEIAKGQNNLRVMEQFKVWDKRKPLVQQALKNHSQASLNQLLMRSHTIDKLIKGLEIGNVWDELTQLVINLCQPTLTCLP